MKTHENMAQNSGFFSIYLSRGFLVFFDLVQTDRAFFDVFEGFWCFSSKNPNFFRRLLAFFDFFWTFLGDPLAFDRLLRKSSHQNTLLIISGKVWKKPKKTSLFDVFLTFFDFFDVFFFVFFKKCQKVTILSHIRRFFFRPKSDVFRVFRVFSIKIVSSHGIYTRKKVIKIDVFSEKCSPTVFTEIGGQKGVFLRVFDDFWRFSSKRPKKDVFFPLSFHLFSKSFVPH